jgi:hypothetical protein
MKALAAVAALLTKTTRCRICRKPLFQSRRFSGHDPLTVYLAGGGGWGGEPLVVRRAQWNHWHSRRWYHQSCAGIFTDQPGGYYVFGYTSPEQQGPAPDPRPEQLPPTGWMQRQEMFDAAVFRRQHEEQLHGYMTAATAQLYQRGTAALLVLPYHYDVLAAARRFLDAEMNDVAVIVAQTSAEIATDDVITALLRHNNPPRPIDEWIRGQIERFATLKADALYNLYRALSGDDLRGNPPLWEPYVRRANLRNDIVHTGAHASKPQAVEACDAALDLIHHFETVRARAMR